MLFRSILSAAMIGLLSLATTTRSADPANPNAVLAVVYKDIGFQGRSQPIRGGCNDLDIEFQSFELTDPTPDKYVYKSICRFYGTQGCQSLAPKFNRTLEDGSIEYGMFYGGYSDKSDSKFNSGIQKVHSIFCRYVGF